MGESLAPAGAFGNSTGYVNGKLTGCIGPTGRSFYRSMDLRRVLGRIEKRLGALQISAHAASEAAGTPDAIRNIKRAVKNGKRQGVSTNTIAALAPVLRTSFSWLADAVGTEDISVDQATIPVWGKAGAGGLVYNFHEGGQEIDRITAPDGANDSTGAVQVDGESLGRLFHGWYAVYDEIRDPPTIDLVGRLCVLETMDGRVFVKKLVKGRGKRFTLESNYEAPIADVQVRWAAPVKNMVPR